MISLGNLLSITWCYFLCFAFEQLNSDYTANKETSFIEDLDSVTLTIILSSLSYTDFPNQLRQKVIGCGFFSCENQSKCNAEGEIFQDQ